jgi:tetratricopeptide (TPR) repeat protein
MTKWFLLPLMCIFGLSGLAQSVTSYSPEKPTWGDTLKIKYDAAAKEAKLKGHDTLFLVYYIEYPDRSAKAWVKMKKTGTAFSAEIPVAEGSAALVLHFAGKEAQDSTASRTAYVYTKAGKPARGANALKIEAADENYLNYFKEELSLYPDNYVAYRLKWTIDFEMRNSRKGVMDALRNEVSALKQKLNNPTPELLYALALGDLLVDQEPEARQMIKDLVAKFPKSPLIRRALIEYDQQIAALQLATTEGPDEIQKLRVDLAMKNPESEFGRDLFRSAPADKSLHLDWIEKAYQAWIKDEPRNPVPYQVIAEVYLQRGINTQKSLELINKALNLTLEGYLLLYEDVSGYLFRAYLPRLYRARADAETKLKNFPSALADLAAAIETSADQKGPLYERIGRIWEDQGYTTKAEESYLQAFMAGDSKARDRLQALYKKTRGTEKGFTEYLDKKRAEGRRRK